MSMHEQREQLLNGLSERANQDITRGDWWHIDQYRYPHPKSPERQGLYAILGENISLQDRIDERRQKGKGTNILELFGSGEFVLEPSIVDSITGIRLLDTSYYRDDYRPRSPKHTVLEANIYEPDSWQKLATHMNANDIPSIDLAVCAPVSGWGGWKNYPLPVFLSVFYPMLQNVYDTLSTDEGTLYTDIPPSIALDPGDLAIWELRMNRQRIKTKVVDTHNGYGAHIASITKTPKSPREIVPLTNQCLMPIEG